jgi:phage baseplate assembly protein W
MPVTTPHLRIPLAFANGKFAVVEQDSPEEIRQCISTVLKTRIGSRIESPNFGVPDELFELLPPNPSAESYIAAIEEWEPRSRVVGEAEIEELTKRVLIRNAENPGA